MIAPSFKGNERGTYTIHRGIRDVQETGWIYKFPSLWECRQRFASEMQQAITWGPDAENTKWKSRAVARS